mmetsp:Transcript_7808/g.27691  ORF Transcript_7808/g.27691 Transcript_7808/m.27691 type:complete len:234 (-) Transcript_7808:201-902(-)
MRVSAFARHRRLHVTHTCALHHHHGHVEHLWVRVEHRRRRVAHEGNLRHHDALLHVLAALARRADLLAGQAAVRVLQLVGDAADDEAYARHRVLALDHAHDDGLLARLARLELNLVARPHAHRVDHGPLPQRRAAVERLGRAREQVERRHRLCRRQDERPLRHRRGAHRNAGHEERVVAVRVRHEDVRQRAVRRHAGVQPQTQLGYVEARPFTSHRVSLDRPRGDGSAAAAAS